MSNTTLEYTPGQPARMASANVQAKLQTNAQVSSTTASPLKRLIQHLRPYRRRVWLAATCSVINKVFDLAPPVLIGLAVDVVVEQDTSWLS